MLCNVVIDCCVCTNDSFLYCLFLILLFVTNQLKLVFATDKKFVKFWVATQWSRTKSLEHKFWKQKRTIIHDKKSVIINIMLPGHGGKVGSKDWIFAKIGIPELPGNCGELSLSFFFKWPNHGIFLFTFVLFLPQSWFTYLGGLWQKVWWLLGSALVWRWLLGNKPHVQ